MFSAFAATLIYAPAYAVETLIELGLEARAYSKSGLPQTHNGKLAISLQPEFTEQFEAQNVYLTFEPFFRLDQYDEERNHADIRELNAIKVYDGVMGVSNPIIPALMWISSIITGCRDK